MFPQNGEMVYKVPSSLRHIQIITRHTTPPLSPLVFIVTISILLLFMLSSGVIYIVSV